MKFKTFFHQAANVLMGGGLERKILFKSLPRRSNAAIYGDFLRYYIKYGEYDVNYWLYDFPHKDRKQQEEYLDYPAFRKHRNRINNSVQSHFSGVEKYNYLALLRDKLLFGQYIGSLGFPTPKNLFFYHKNQFYDLSTGTTADKDHILANDADIFCKLVYGECGKGVYHLRVTDGKLTVDGEPMAVADFFALLSDAGFLFQQTLTQHPVLNHIYPHSINPLRTRTRADDNGKIHHLDSALRIGAGGNNIDNWFAGGLVVGIDRNGRLKETASHEFVVNGHITHRRHPDTDVEFKGVQLPDYKEAIDMAWRLHALIPGIAAIGWDIAFTPEGPCIVEGNDNFEISLNQVANGGLRGKWNSILGQ